MKKRQALATWQDIEFLAVVDGQLEELLQSLEASEKNCLSGQIEYGQLLAEMPTYATSLVFLKTLHNKWHTLSDLTVRQNSTLQSLAYRLAVLEEKIQRLLCLEGLDTVCWQVVSLRQKIHQNADRQSCHFVHDPLKSPMMGQEHRACANF